MTVENYRVRTDFQVSDGVNRTYGWSGITIPRASMVVVDIKEPGPDGAISTISTGFLATVLGETSGTVLLSAPVPAGKGVSIRRYVPYIQSTQIGNQGAFFPELHEEALDLLTMQTQQLAAALGDDGTIGAGGGSGGGGGGVDYGPQIVDLQNRVGVLETGSGSGGGWQETRVSLIESKNQTQDARLSGLDDDIADHESRISELEETGGSGALTAKTPVRYIKADTLNDTGLFEQTATTFAKAQELREHLLPYNPTTTQMNYIAHNLRVVAEGGAMNGPINASIALGIHLSKEGFGTSTAKTGEIDAIYIALRQDGVNGTRADAAGILIDANNSLNTGFTAGVEGMTRVLLADGSVWKRVGYQIGVAETLGTGEPLTVGAQLSAYEGNLSYGLIIGSENAGGSGGTFVYPLQIHDSGRELVRVANNGRVRLGAQSGSADKITICTSAAGNFSILNNPETTEILQLTQTGVMTVAGSIGTGSVTATTGMSSPNLVLPYISNGNIKTRIRTNSAGGFGVANGADTQELFSVSTAGNGQFAGSLSSGSYGTAGLVSSGTLNVSGNATISGTLSAGSFAPSTISMSGSITAGSLASNGNASVAGTITASTLTLGGTSQASTHYTKYYAFFDAVGSAPASGGVLYFQAGTGNFVYHNGSTWRTISST